MNPQTAQNKTTNKTIKNLAVVLLCVVVGLIVYNYLMVKTYDIDKQIPQCRRYARDRCPPGSRGIECMDNVKNTKKPRDKKTENADPEEGKVKVVFYHAGWCPHCVHIMKEQKFQFNNNGTTKNCSLYEYLQNTYADDDKVVFVEFQQDFNDSSNPDNKIIRENIAKEIKKCSDLKGFPTIKIVTESKTEEYNGPRTAEGFTSAINAKLAEL